jgi:hypothetical protein
MRESGRMKERVTSIECGMIRDPIHCTSTALNRAFPSVSPLFRLTACPLSLANQKGHKDATKAINAEDLAKTTTLLHNSLAKDPTQDK